MYVTHVYEKKQSNSRSLQSKTSDANNLQKKKNTQEGKRGTELMYQTKPKIIVTEGDLNDASQRSIDGRNEAKRLFLWPS